MQRKFWLINLLLVFTMVACSISEATAEKPPLDFQEAYLNQQIKLRAGTEFNTFKTTDSIWLVVMYNSENQIKLARNYDIRIFIKQDAGWLEIQERSTERSPVAGIVLSPNDPTSYNLILSFDPMLPDVKKLYKLRVYIFGDMTTSDGITKVGAYADVSLKP